VPPIETALRILAEREPSSRPHRTIIGSPSAVKKGIEELASLYGAQEVMIVTITFAHGARRRSYELIAEAFGLS
jgi:alkanesulfonate monooxygenase SsuD/methylene tetrahydromethanopterin reductase-like flavin-dependent oxidoreductase (luciferase family)